MAAVSTVQPTATFNGVAIPVRVEVASLSVLLWSAVRSAMIQAV